MNNQGRAPSSHLSDEPSKAHRSAGLVPGSSASSVKAGAPLIIPNFIDTIRMYRKECDMTLEDAKARAIREFDKRRWPHPYQKGKT